MLTITIYIITVVLNQLLLTEKDIYVSYQYIDTDNFFLTISNCVTNNKNITKEMNNLQAFLDQYKNLAGLTLALDITVNIYYFTLNFFFYRPRGRGIASA